jgi:hypothetical protein
MHIKNESLPITYICECAFLLFLPCTSPPFMITQIWKKYVYVYIYIYTHINTYMCIIYMHVDEFIYLSTYLTVFSVLVRWIDPKL